MKLLSILVSFMAASSAVAFAPSKIAPSSGPRTTSAEVSTTSVSMAASSEELYIDDDRRFLMNLILLGSAGLTVGAIGIPYILFFLPPSSGGDGGGIPAKDALGDDIFAQAYLTDHPAGDHSLAQGLKGDATYIIVKDDSSIETYGLNAVCTHLGCVVPWSAANNKFMCPCHGSQYAPDGHVVRGPAPLPLALAHCETSEDGKITFSPWTEDDFRTGSKGWWN